MSITAHYLYDHYLYVLHDLIANDYSSDVRVALLNSKYKFDSAHAYWKDVMKYEVCSKKYNYPPYGVVLEDVHTQHKGDCHELCAESPVVFCEKGDITASYAVVYVVNPGFGNIRNDSRLISCIEFEHEQSSWLGEFQMHFKDNVIVRWHGSVVPSYSDDELGVTIEKLLRLVCAQKEEIAELKGELIKWGY